MLRSPISLFSAVMRLLVVAVLAGACMAAISYAQSGYSQYDQPDRLDELAAETNAGASLPDRAADLAQNRQIASNAQQEVTRAGAELRQARAAAQEELSRSLNLDQARQELKQTRDAYQAARDKALGQLTGNTQYQQARAALAQFDDRITAAHKDPDTPRTTTLELAQQRLAQAERVTAMEERVLVRDDQIEPLRQQAAQAAAEVRQIHQQIDSQVNQSPAVAAATENFHRAQSQAESTRVALASASAAYREAAYQQQRQEALYNRNYRYGYDSPYGYPYRYHGRYGHYRGQPVFIDGRNGALDLLRQRLGDGHKIKSQGHQGHSGQRHQGQRSGQQRR
ncbi:MAG: hypothetical protein WD042_13750 [Phycisphaeraceae bacterium]